MKKSGIEGDTLVRYEQAYTGEGGMSYTKRIPVITKDEFKACYRAWILGEAGEDADLLKRIEKVEGASAKLERRLNALISCLYPTCISKDDVCFIDSQEITESEDQ